MERWEGGGLEGGSGSFVVPGNILDVSVNASEFHGSMHVALSQLNISGMASMNKLVLLETITTTKKTNNEHDDGSAAAAAAAALIAAPSAPVMGLRNAFGMDKVGMSMGVSVQFDSAQANLNDTFVLSMAMEKVELDAAVNLAMSEPAALNLRLDQFSSVDCIFSTIRNTSAMTALTLVLGGMRLGIDCSCEEKCACSSPLMAALSTDLASPNGTAQLLSFAQEGLSGLTKRLLNPSKDFAKAMDEELRKATTRCHAPPKVDHGDGPPPDVLAMPIAKVAFHVRLPCTICEFCMTVCTSRPRCCALPMAIRQLPGLPR